MTLHPQVLSVNEAPYFAFFAGGVSPADPGTLFGKGFAYDHIVYDQVSLSQLLCPVYDSPHQGAGGERESAQQTIEGIMGPGGQPSGDAGSGLPSVQQEQSRDVDGHQPERQGWESGGQTKHLETSHHLFEDPPSGRIETGRHGGNTSRETWFVDTLFYLGGVPFCMSMGYPANCVSPEI